MKKFLKVFIIIAIVLTIVLTCVSVIAIETTKFNPKNYTDPGGEGEIRNIGSNIIFAFQAVGAFFATGILAYVGIQYMIASPSEKADIKGRMVPYIVGAMMVFSMTAILQIAKTIMDKTA